MPSITLATFGPVVVLCTMIAASTSCGRAGRSSDADNPDTPLRQALQSAGQPSFVTSDKEGARLWKQTRAFYEKRGMTPPG